MIRSFVRQVYIYVLIIVTAISLVAQPVVEQNRAAGKAAFDEAIQLRNQNTYRSYLAALEQFRLSEKLYAEIGDQANVGSALLGQGLIKDLLDEKQASLELYLRALEIFRNVKHAGLEARTLNNIGQHYSEIGDAKKAIGYFELALPLRLTVGDKYGESNTHNSIGAAYSSIGERAKALHHFNRALAIRIAIDDKRAQAVTLSNLGRLYDDLGDKQKAIEYLERSLALRLEVKDQAGQAVTLNNLGMATSDSGDVLRAIQYYDASVAIFRDLEMHNRKAAIFSNLSAAYITLEKFDKAVIFARDALDIYRRVNDKTGEATALSNFGFATVKAGDKLSGLDYLNRALVLARSIDSRGLEAIVLGNLMQTSRQLDRPAVAVIFGKQAVDVYQQLRVSIRDLDPSIQRTYLKSVEDNYRELADLLIELGRFSEADEVLAMLKEEELSAFTRRNTEAAGRLERRTGLTKKEKLVASRYATLAAAISQPAAELQKLEERKRLLSRRDETLTADEENRFQALTAQVAAANDAFRKFLEIELVRELGREAVQKIEVDRSMQAKLRKWGDGTVLLNTVVTAGRYRVVLTTPKIQLAAKTEISSTLLNKKIFAFRKALVDTDVDPRPLAKELYDILIKPIEKDLIAADAKTLVWSLDGVLRYIPLAALSPDGKGYLVEKYQNAIITPRTRDAIGDSAREWRALGFGISEAQEVTYPEYPDKKQKVEALPGTKLELAAIIRDENAGDEKGILPGKRFIDREFTVKNMTDSLAAEMPDGRSRYNVVHLASHFHLGRDWSNSYLFLGGGKLLTLEELSNTAQFDFGEVEIVTLSACNTALGGPESGREVDSLAGVIEAKSGKAVLATLWAVSDNSTPQLMREFYRVRNQGGRATKADALRQAQLSLLTSTNPDASFSHPYFWSGFVLIGNWR